MIPRTLVSHFLYGCELGLISFFKLKLMITLIENKQLYQNSGCDIK